MTDRNGAMRRRVLASVVVALGGIATSLSLLAQRPSHFIFVVNLKIAKALGITIPPGVMVRAARVIE